MSSGASRSSPGGHGGACGPGTSSSGSKRWVDESRQSSLTSGGTGSPRSSSIAEIGASRLPTGSSGFRAPQAARGGCSGPSRDSWSTARRRPGSADAAGPRQQLLGLDPAEQPVRLVVRAGREVERVRRARTGPVAEAEAPETIDRHRFAVGRAQLTAVRERAVSLRRVRVDRPVAEVADEQVAAEAAKVRRRHRKSPGSVQLPARGDAGDEGPVSLELVDEAEALSSHLVIASALLRVGDEQMAADVLDPEGAVAGGQSRVDE